MSVAVDNDPADAAHGEIAATVVESHTWTGEVEAQRQDGRRLIILLILAVAIGSPFAVWLSLCLARMLLS
ncbi:MAG: hypothetical protein U1E42_14515 [Rhodospirillales bacterium]